MSCPGDTTSSDELFNFGESQRPSMATGERERDKRSNEEPEETQTGGLWGLEEPRGNPLLKLGQVKSKLLFFFGFFFLRSFASFSVRSQL